MTQSKNHQFIRGVLDNKAAGLESHQFARETNRFNTIFTPQDYTKNHLPRQPRVGQNSRNESDQVFQFSAKPLSDKPATKFQPTSDPSRFTPLSVEQEEKARMNSKREKFLQRVEVKREWKNEIEANRWGHEDQIFQKEQTIISNRRKNAKIGMSSVSYNPITLEYQNNERGATLRKQDAQAKHRLSIRTAKLYVQRNTFDPTRCMDIPRFPHLNPVSTDKPAGVKSVVLGSHIRNRGPATEASLDSTVIEPSTVSHLIKQQIEAHENKVKEITGEKPTLKESLLQWKIHF